MAVSTAMFAARGPLAGVVEAFWACEVEGGAPGAERILPNGAIELVVDLRDARRGALVCGAHDEPFVIERAARESIVGVHFAPGGAAAYLGVPADELRGRQVPLEALWGRAARELRERLLDAPDATARVRVLEQALLARRRELGLRHAGVDFALRSLARAPSERAIAALADAAGLSARRFIARFAAQVGLPPKRFARVRRFQTVLERAATAPLLGWSRLALDCGYYDQAHLIRDFRGFAGMSPGEYLRVQTHDRNHVPHAA